MLQNPKKIYINLNTVAFNIAETILQGAMQSHCFTANVELNKQKREETSNLQCVIQTKK